MKRKRLPPHTSPTSSVEPQKYAARWLNGIPAVAAYTGCSRRTVQNWVSSGRLSVKRHSARHLLVLPEDVDQLIIDLDREYRLRVGRED